MRLDLAGSRRANDTRRRARLAALGPCLLTCVATTPALAYRTGEDSPALAGRGRIAWSSNQVSFSLSSNDLPQGVTKAQVEEALSASLQTWIAPECSAIEPIFEGWTDAPPATRDGKNTIAWVNDWTKRGFPKLAPGNTDMQYRGHDDAWEIAEADVYLDAADFDWTTADGKDTSVQAVLTHELGHALGLLHPCEDGGADGAPACEDAPSDVEASTMYPFYSASQASLEADDVAGICYLYPADTDCKQLCLARETCVEGECRAMCGDDICAAGDACGPWGCANAEGCLDRDCVGHSCAGEGSCGPLATCKKGMCVAGTVEWGDKCGKSSDCADGACVEGRCQPDCQSDDECGPLGSCEPSVDGPASGCTSSSAYGRGMHCAAGEDCRSGICLFTEHPALCTDECSSQSDCPRDWSCKTVDQREVCVPPTVEPSGGCTVGRGRNFSDTGANAPFGWICLATALLATRRLRRKNDT
jgi:hypothetical protein